MSFGEFGRGQSHPHAFDEERTLRVAELAERNTEPLRQGVVGFVKLPADGTIFECVAKAFPRGGPSEFGTTRVASDEEHGAACPAPSRSWFEHGEDVESVVSDEHGVLHDVVVEVVLFGGKAKHPDELVRIVEHDSEHRFERLTTAVAFRCELWLV